VLAKEPTSLIDRVDLSKLDYKQNPKLVGIFSTLVTGNPGKEGLYSATGLMKKGAVFPPHSHPDKRMSVVISGVMYLGHGEAYSETALVAYPVGTVAITPANVPHFMAAKDGDVRILEIGSGPSGMTFLSR